MESDYTQDLPDDILEKLRNLELELEDGDITLKGFEKKKASLLADVSNPSSPISPTNQKSDAEILAELGPEPSAADIVDFLDFLPSPTHSPTRTAEAVSHMEENHRQIQQQQQPQQQQPQQPQQQYYQHQQYQQLQPQPRPWPQQQQYQPSAGQQFINPQQQQQQMRPMQHQFRPGGGLGRGNNAGPYYSNTNMGSPLPTNRPFMVPNNYPQQQPLHQPSMMRPGPNTYYGQRPTPIPSQNINYGNVATSPRPMYRPQSQSQPQPRPNGVYRPQQTYNGLPLPPQSQQQQHVDDDFQKTGLKRTPSITSLNANPVRFSASSSSTTLGQAHLPPSQSFADLSLPTASLPRKTNLSKYGNTSMTRAFHSVEPLPVPRIIAENANALEELAGRQMQPSLPRDIPFKVIDAQDKQDPSLFYSIAELLRYRASDRQGRIIPAFTQVDDKGKAFSSVTWEKLGARAEKVAMVIRDKSALEAGSCVALVYRKTETIDFIVAMLGCFIAGLVAVPINATEELSELWFILRVSNAHLVLTTDTNLKTLTKTMKLRNLDFPKNVDWWPTNDFGSLYVHQIKSGRYSALRSTPLAYIEYTKSINGELKGVAVSHQAIMSGCHSYTAAKTETVVFTAQDKTTSVLPNWDTQGSDTLLTYLESRQQLGLNISVLGSIYSGGHTIFASANIMETPAVWIYVVSKYKVTIALAGYPGMFYAAKYYQKNPRDVSNYSKKTVPDLSSLRLLFIDTLVVKPETNDYIANNLLRPLGKTMSQDPLEVVTPVLSLPEHAGAIVSFRDYLGPGKLKEIEHKDDATTYNIKDTSASGRSREAWECILDADALRIQKVVVLATSSSADISGEEKAGCLKVGSHGFPFPNSSIAVVDPETSLFCPPDTIGEIWLDAPSLADGFWGIPALTDAVYHANPVIVPAETLYPETYDQAFLRTGLLGTIIGERLVVLGAYEDRVRQQRLGNELGVEETHISTDVFNTITKKTRVDSCVIFDIQINGQYLPVLVIESNLVDQELSNLVENASSVVQAYHGLRLYTAISVNRGHLPRFLKDGNQYIHHLITKRRFLAGQLSINYMKMDVDRTVFNEAASSSDNQDVSVWRLHPSSYERALASRLISPRPQPQHSGVEIVKATIDERSGYDLSRFTNLVDIMLWRTSLFPEENAFAVVNQSGTKPLSWRKFNNQVATIANYFVKKCLLKAGTRVLVLLHFGPDFVRVLYACFVLGLIPVLCPPPELLQPSQKRLQEDINIMVRTIHDLNIQHIIVNSQSEDILRNKNVLQSIKISITRTGKLIGMKQLPDRINIDKAPRFNKMLGPESGFSVKSEWTTDKKRPAFLLIRQSETDDNECGTHQYIPYSHDTIVAQCRSQKLTCQIKFQKPLIVTGLSAFEGLGVLYAAFCGVYVGCTTILMPTVDFKTSTATYFELIARNKCPTICANYMLFDFAMNKIPPNEQRRIPLQNTQNIMLSVSSRTKPRFYDKISRYLSLSRVEREAINTVYSHPLNPMITTRSFMLLEPISLIADFEWLRQGIIRPLAQGDDSSYGVLLHDSGIVPTNTMIAIVNPETLCLCPSHVIGEIWVSSDSNVKGIYDSSIDYTNTFEATIHGTDPRIKYMRTGDIGFLWNVKRKAIGMQAPVEEGQCLYILGHIEEIITSKGLLHFAIDIEETVENCHPDVLGEGCYVIQLDTNEIIVVAAIRPSIISYLGAIPVIVSSILERHSLLIDTILLVTKDQLPKKYNGEKLRKKVLSMYYRKEISTIHVSRIKNQHQPMTLPRWSGLNIASSSSLLRVDNSDNQSMISFSQRSQLNFDTNNSEVASINRQSSPAAISTKSYHSTTS
ncbi:hypothetical protein [Parasitella parasitica]|uniref:DMAP1-binding domain-containing protein n=1 Tax=Parasitella parasitica TaxID=35722 RepID=A0A0B7NHJ3_9FUNG|nr:hypothetical protein [Parasitella parasitica]